MGTDLTELVFILDRSGSMGGLESDTIGGFNSMLERQKTEAGKCRITTVLFDDKYELLHDRIDLDGVAPLTEKDYCVRGNTALLDAMGKTIHKIREVQKHTNEKHRADKVLFLITTDGLENASRQFSHQDIKRLIDHQKSKHNWEFIFLGANIDTAQVGESIGIQRDHSYNWLATGQGVKSLFNVVSIVASSYRSGFGCDIDQAKSGIVKNTSNS